MHESIAQASRITAKLFPVPSSHRRELPGFVRDLSRMLTEDRSEMSRPYWASPGLFSAYLHFFLPWNLYRLAWLLPGLDIHLAKNARVLDLGSGPLTLPLALWCARPELRALPLQFTCVDVSMQAMERGLAILKALAGAECPWEISLVRGPLEKALPSSHGRAGNKQPYDCIMAANVLNELGNERARAGAAPLEQRLAELVQRVLAGLAPNGRVLLVEPGTRLGGKVISFARAAAIDMGCKALAPCPHSGRCPMQPDTDEAGPRSGPSFSGWCHFTHPVVNAPESLASLGEEAHLHKRSMALSCVLLQKTAVSPAEAFPGERPEDAPTDSGGPDELTGLDELEALYAEIMQEDEPDSPPPTKRAGPSVRHDEPGKSVSGPMLTRVISGPITLNGREEPGRYACCENGLALLLDAGNLPSGALVEAAPPKRQSGTSEGRNEGREQRDRKSGALLLIRSQKAGSSPVISPRKAEKKGLAAPDRARKAQGTAKPRQRKTRKD